MIVISIGRTWRFVEFVMWLIVLALLGLGLPWILGAFVLPPHGS